MKALIFDKSKSDWETSKGFERAEVPMSKLDDEKQVLIKVHYAGVCGTDKGIWHRQAMRDQILGSLEAESNPSRPSGTLPSKGEGNKVKTFRILGHEFFGEIAEVGKEAVKDYKLKKGDFVSCESHVVDNKCFQCLHGQKNVCTKEKILGISYDGCFAEYIKVPAHIVWKTDTSKIRPEVAALEEPFGNAVHAASKVDLKDKTIAIFGLGPIGMFLLLVARGIGAKHIIGVEPNPIAIEMAKRLGIDYVIKLDKSNLRTNTDLTQTNTDRHPHLNPPPSRGRKFPFDSPPLVGGVRGGGDYAHNLEITDEIMKITKGIGVDVSFEMAGFNDSLNNAIFATRRGGDVILFGLKTGDFIIEDYNRLIIRGLTLHAVIGRQLWGTWEVTRKLMEDASNGIQEKIFNIILNRGEGTILPISEYTKEKFEKMMSEHPKFLIQF